MSSNRTWAGRHTNHRCRVAMSTDAGGNSGQQTLKGLQLFNYAVEEVIATDEDAARHSKAPASDPHNSLMPSTPPWCAPHSKCCLETLTMGGGQGRATPGIWWGPHGRGLRQGDGPELHQPDAAARPPAVADHLRAHDSVGTAPLSGPPPPPLPPFRPNPRRSKRAVLDLPPSATSA